jgi:hypothetical protein
MAFDGAVVEVRQTSMDGCPPESAGGVKVGVIALENVSRTEVCEALTSERRPMYHRCPVEEKGLNGDE